ncbi:MAG: iron-containing alcohol dehydrogenase [Chloroflexi bacterium]|nr:iron-containing alcohol dehydrogenase [Chloroflexota bacterium]MCL5108053.1 iron-containing alcohol dehydrogenase [Chloroflexota bacterium]
MSKNYIFRFPTPVEAGAGMAGQVGARAKALGASKVLVVTDPGIAKTPHLKTVTDSLEKAGVAYDVFAKVEPDPSIENVEDNVAEVKAAGYDGYVALGGGSSIDVAKGLRLLSQYGGKLRDYSPGDKIPGPLAAPLIAISTTAGTGSQVSNGAVFSDNARGTKFAVSSPKNCPTLALNDPLVTMGAPGKVTATAGMDALGHAIECYLSVNANPMSDILVLDAISKVARSLPRVMANGDDLAAREEMLLAATTAIVGASNCGLGADHAVAMPLCSLFHQPHGLIIGMMLAPVMEYNQAAAEARLADVAVALGVNTAGMSQRQAAAAAVVFVRNLTKEIGLPQRLREIGVAEEKLAQVAELTMESHQVANNRRKMDPASLLEMLRQAY